MPLPCQRPESPRDIDSGISEESALFLRAVGIAEARGFDWLQIKPENRTDWARRVLEWESDERKGERAMTGQHTPGPWAVHPASARVDSFNTGSPVPVCKMLWPTDERSEAETEANAHLISAAPDLLGALRFILAFYEPGQKYLDTEAWKVAEASAREAVAKAEGRTP